jgi:hypothetical protein
VATFVSKQFVWRPKWVSWSFLLLLCLAIPGVLLLITGALRTKRMIVDCPVCERHRNYWAWRGFWVYAPLLVLTITTLIMSILAVLERMPGPSFPILFLGVAFLLVIWAVASTIIQRTGIKAIEITDEEITLEPVHAAFLDQVRLGRAQAKARRGWALEWEDYDPYPRKPP